MSRGFRVDDDIDQLFLTSTATFLDDIKEWLRLLYDTQLLGVMLNFNVDVKILLLTSKF